MLEIVCIGILQELKESKSPCPAVQDWWWWGVSWDRHMTLFSPIQIYIKQARSIYSSSKISQRCAVLCFTDLLLHSITMGGEGEAPGIINSQDMMEVRQAVSILGHLYLIPFSFLYPPTPISTEIYSSSILFQEKISPMMNSDGLIRGSTKIKQIWTWFEILTYWLEIIIMGPFFFFFGLHVFILLFPQIVGYIK